MGHARSPSDFGSSPRALAKGELRGTMTWRISSHWKKLDMDRV